MTMIEALPRDIEGYIVIPVGSIDEEGNAIEGITSEAFLQNRFANFVNKQVILSEADYQALLTASVGNWKLNWKAFREQGVI